MEKLEILQNDAAMLDVSSRREARPGLWIISYPGELMPNGFPFEVQIRGQLNHTALLDFIKQVRQEYARQTGAETETSDEAPARDVSSSPADPEPRVEGGGGVPTPPPIPDVESTLEDVIAAQVARLRSEVLAVEHRITELGTARTRIIGDLARAEAALGAYNDEEVLPAPKAVPRRKPRRTKKPAPSKGQAVKSDGGEVGDSAENS